MSIKSTAKCFITTVIIILVLIVPVAAGPAYNTYTYSYGDNERLLSPAAMKPASVYRGEDMGTVALTEPRDVFSASDGRLYIADSGNNRILSLDENYRVKREYKTFVSDGTEDTFNKPESVFVTAEDEMYIADTENSRIIVLKASDGSLLRVIGRPETELLDWSDYTYKPIALTVDNAGRISVVSRSVYLGIISLERDGSFAGFLGAKKVNPNLVELLWRKFMTKEQLARMEKFMPSEYNNIALDSQGFLFATTDSIEPANSVQFMLGNAPDSTPVKRLNPTGIDVLKRNGRIPPGGDAKIDVNDKGEFLPSVITDVAPTGNGIYSLLDARTNTQPPQNKIFTYDSNGNLLYAFGGIGEQQGLFAGATSICYHGRDLLVLDNSGTLTRFVFTEYGEKLFSAIDLTEQRQYDIAAAKWQEVLKENNNFEMAENMIGEINLREEKYEEAMERFQRSGNLSGYSEAYTQVRREQIRQNIIWLLLGAAALIAAVILFFRKSSRVNKNWNVPRDKWTIVRQMNYGFHSMLHPFGGSWDLVHENRGSIASATAVLSLSVFSRVLFASSSGYLTGNSTDRKFYLIESLFSIVAPLVLWIIANWCMTTLMDGQGKMSDIYKASAYATFPYIITYIPITIISHFVTQQELTLINMVVQIVTFWVLLLMFLSMLTVHQFSLPKGTLAAILTLIGMAIILFLGMLFLMLVSKMAGGFSNIFREIAFTFE